MRWQNASCEKRSHSRRGCTNAPVGLPALKVAFRAAPNREAATRLFDEFIATSPTDNEIEVASVYYAWRLFDFSGVA
jgi:hypothetical protein